MKAWRQEPFKEDKGIIATFQALQKPAIKREELSRLSSDAGEIVRLWKYIHSNKKDFGQEDVTAEMASERAGPPVQQQQQQQQRVASAAVAPGAAAANPAIASSVKAQPSAPTTAVKAATQTPTPAGTAKATVVGQASVKPDPQASAAAAATGPRGVGGAAVAAAKPSVSHRASVIGAAAPAPAPPAGALAGRPVPVASFVSTGDVARDQVVAALHAALSAGSVGPLEASQGRALRVVFELRGGAFCASTRRSLRRPCYPQAAVAIERCVSDAVGGAAGGPPSRDAYLRRSFLLWSLLSPDSEGYSSELRELVLEGGVTPEALASLSL